MIILWVISMNKEVKELIDRLKQDSDCEDIYWVGYVDGMNCDVEITSKEMKLLLDCINQLEEKVRVLDLLENAFNKEEYEFLKREILEIRGGSND